MGAAVGAGCAVVSSAPATPSGGAPGGSGAASVGAGPSAGAGVRTPLKTMREPSGDQATSSGKTPVRPAGRTLRMNPPAVL
jgi:hypothetical protein